MTRARGLRVLSCALAAAALASLLPAAAAQALVPLFAPRGAASAAQRTAGLSPEQKMERRFLQEAAAHQRFVTDAARLAQSHSTAASVRELAQSVLKQQKETGDDLVRLLHARGMAAPMLPNEQSKLLKSLAKATGRKLDRMFIDDVIVRAQGGALRDYERSAQALQDPHLRAWIQAQLPAMRHQLAVAERAAGGGATARSSR